MSGLNRKRSGGGFKHVYRRALASHAASVVAAATAAMVPGPHGDGAAPPPVGSFTPADSLLGRREKAVRVAQANFEAARRASPQYDSKDLQLATESLSDAARRQLTLERRGRRSNERARARQVVKAFMPSMANAREAEGPVSAIDAFVRDVKLRLDYHERNKPLYGGGAAATLIDIPKLKRILDCARRAATGGDTSDVIVLD